MCDVFGKQCDYFADRCVKTTATENCVTDGGTNDAAITGHLEYVRAVSGPALAKPVTGPLCSESGKQCANIASRVEQQLATEVCTNGHVIYARAVSGAALQKPVRGRGVCATSWHAGFSRGQVPSSWRGAEGMSTVHVVDSASSCDLRSARRRLQVLSKHFEVGVSPLDRERGVRRPRWQDQESEVGEEVDTKSNNIEDIPTFAAWFYRTSGPDLGHLPHPHGAIVCRASGRS